VISVEDGIPARLAPRLLQDLAPFEALLQGIVGELNDQIVPVLPV
jgi:hypothetical protein